MIRSPVLAAFFLLLGLSITTESLATRAGRSLPLDKRIQLITYHPNDVFSYTGHVDYQSNIVFSPEERIVSLAIGNGSTNLPTPKAKTKKEAEPTDPTIPVAPPAPKAAPAGNDESWKIEPMGNRIFLKPTQEDANTNMTVITTKRVYQFELHSRAVDPEKGIHDEQLVFELRFVYPDENASGSLQYNYQSGMPDLSQPEKYNFNYSMAGAENISPIRIFDDGEFTYFQFSTRNADIPAFFMVDSNGNESLVNYRVMGDYIVIERVAPNFTLRHGPDVLCIFNEGKPAKFKTIKKR